MHQLVMVEYDVDITMMGIGVSRARSIIWGQPGFQKHELWRAIHDFGDFLWVCFMVTVWGNWASL